MSEFLPRFYEKLSGRKRCYCAFCKTPKMVYLKRRVGITNVLVSFAASLSVMYTIWHEFDARFLVFFGVFLGAAEVFLQMRWRMALVCRECGFDPALYLMDQKKAAEKVRRKLERRKADPASLLRTPLNLPKISKQALAKSSGNLVSKQV